jgi:hypothetical protein
VDNRCYRNSVKNPVQGVSPVVVLKLICYRRKNKLPGSEEIQDISWINKQKLLDLVAFFRIIRLLTSAEENRVSPAHQGAFLRTL